MMKLVRLFTVALALLMAFAAANVSAQTGRQSDKMKKNIWQEKENADAYKSALERIPDSGAKYDPWGNMRTDPEPAPVKAKKK
jgi:hypothetical protein